MLEISSFRSSPTKPSVTKKWTTGPSMASNDTKAILLTMCKCNTSQHDTESINKIGGLQPI